MIRVLPALIDLALLVFCLIDCIQSPETEVRNLPKWAWILLIIILPLVGGVAWLVAGRPVRSTSSMPYKGNRGSGGPAGPAGPTAGFPERGRAPRGPDDDPAFLAGLKRADAEHEDVLKRWEADLRRREEELKAKERPEDDPPATTS